MKPHVLIPRLAPPGIASALPVFLLCWMSSLPSVLGQGGLDSFNPNANGRVRALAVQSDGRIVIGGNFTSVSTTNRNHVARVNADGSLDSSFDPGAGANGEVWSLALQPDGKVLVGGGFSSFGGRGYLVRLNANGSLDATFNPGPNDGVRYLVVQADGKILVAGAFTSLGGTNCNYLGRLNANGTLDHGFNAGADAQVNTLLEQPEGKILVGGFFTTLGGATQNFIGRILDDGQKDFGFSIVTDGAVWKLAADRDDGIIIGGSFTTLGGFSRTNIGRVFTFDFVDSSFNPGANSTVNSLAVQLDGRIVCGGNFTLLGGKTNKYLARLNANGTLDNTFTNMGANDTLFSLALQSDGKVLFGGAFTTLGALTRNSIGRFGQALPRPLNDNFANRSTLLLTSNMLSLTSSNLAATSELGEINFLGNMDGGRSVWYSYTPQTQGLLRVLLSPPCCSPSGEVIDPVDYNMYLARGASVSNLTGVVSPILVDNGSLNRMTRAVYADLLPGQECVIAVDGAYNDGIIVGGEFGLDLRFVPANGNDNFEQRSNLLGNDFSLLAPFFAASRQTGEPSHGGGNGSLWWKWTAPFSGLATLRGTQPGNFVPNLAVYQGSQLANLTTVNSTAEIIGHTRQLRFPAVQGQSYALAISGAKFDTNAFPHIDDDSYGSGRFEFNFATLAARLTNLVATTNLTNGVVFSVSARVENFGSLTTGPLRFRLVAKQGQSLAESFSSNPGELAQTTLGTFNPPPPGQASPGLNNPVALGGTCPAPSEGDFNSGTGWEVFCLLEEQLGTNWFLRDKLLVLQGVWPSVRGFGGPGGGVIRLDPGLASAAYDELLSVQILGPSPIYEGARTSYVGRATFAVAPTYDFTNTLWQATRFTITNGVFKAGIVTNDTAVTITAQYGFAGLDYSANRNINVLNLPSPSLTFSSSIPLRPFKLSLSGVRERQHVIEATTNLNPPSIWIPLATNKATNVSGLSGFWNFTDLASTNLGKRFYRAREVE